MDSETHQELSEIEKLRNEFTEQFSTLKSTFETSVKQKDEEITNLTQQNEELRRALVRSAVMGETSQEEKTPEQIEAERYQKEVETLSARTLEMMKTLS